MLFRVALLTATLAGLSAPAQNTLTTYLGGSRMDAVTGIAVDGAGYIHVAGWTDSVNLPVLNAAQRMSGGGVDAFVAMLTPDGSKLVYLTYLGGIGDDRAFALAVDAAGNTYVTGHSTSGNFPRLGGYPAPRTSGKKAFLTKLNASGSIVYSLLTGGSGQAAGSAVAVDAAGSAYVAGWTTSPDFATGGSAQAQFGGLQDGFVLKLNPAGSGAEFSTYIGGRLSDWAKAIALDSARNIYVTGETESSDFPTPSGYRRSLSGQDAFAVKISSAGQSFVYGTFLGGSGTQESGTGIAVDAAGSAYICGITNALDFPTTSGFQIAPGGGGESFVTKLSPAGNGLVYSTYLGGSGLDFATSVAVDQTGRAWVAGYTSSADFPRGQSGSVAPHGDYDGYIAQLSADGRQLLTAWTFGDAGSDAIGGLALRNGQLYAAGQTSSLALQVTSAYQPLFGGMQDGFIAAFSIADKPSSGLRFVPIQPCRVADTRFGGGMFGGPIMSPGQIRTFNVPAAPCGVPANAGAFALNIAVVPPAGLGYITVWPAGKPQPPLATLTSHDGRIRSTAMISGAGVSGGVSVMATDPTHVVVDVNGYFIPESEPAGLAFYPLPPCRWFDSRMAQGAFGGPMLTGGLSRTVPLSGNPCGIPSAASAYSVNLTAIPPQGTSYVTAWPAGQERPTASVLNANNGVITANAAILPGGLSGDITVYPSATMHLIIDVNGYYAPPGPGGMSLHVTDQCRAADTRPAAFQGRRDFTIAGGACALPLAPVYVTAATVYPAPITGFLSLWNGEADVPVVSTLNSYDGAITSNLAVVPAVNGSLSAWASHSGSLTLDVNGYFAP